MPDTEDPAIVATLHRLEERIVLNHTETVRRFTALNWRLAHIEQLARETKALVDGGREPDKGLVIKVARLSDWMNEQTWRQRTVAGAAVAGIAGGVASMITFLTRWAHR